MSNALEGNPGSHYSPEDLAILAGAYETICDAARLRQASPMILDLVAATILDTAVSGERDPLRIVDHVMTKLGLATRYAA